MIALALLAAWIFLGSVIWAYLDEHYYYDPEDGSFLRYYDERRLK